MDKTPQLVALIQRLNLSSATRDWQALASADRDASLLLESMGPESSWTISELRQVRTLWQAHQRAYSRCSQELSLLDDRLRAMRAHQLGWIAYAQYSEHKEIFE
jgi:hypothetical protein